MRGNHPIIKLVVVILVTSLLKSATTEKCLGKGKSCTVFNDRCCTRTSQCGTQNKCESCGTIGASCSEKFDCCKRNSRCVGQKCQRCVHLSQECSAKIRCCSGVCRTKKNVVGKLYTSCSSKEEEEEDYPFYPFPYPNYLHYFY